MSDSPLQNQSNWSKPLSLIVPVEVIIMVDDPTNPAYRSLAEDKVLKPVLNELRSVCGNFDKSGKQLFIKFRPTMSLQEFEALVGANKSAEPSSEMLESLLKKMAELEKKLK